MIGPSRTPSHAINWELVKQAHQISPSDRLLDGPRLFDMTAMFARAGIREQHPDATEDEILERLRARIAFVERMERRR